MYNAAPSNFQYDLYISVVSEYLDVRRRSSIETDWGGQLNFGVYDLYSLFGYLV